MPFFILLTSVISLFSLAPTASAVTSSTLNFQGRLLSSTGTLVPDGSYNIEFKIYDDDLAGTNHWTETRSGGSALTVQNGYFSAYLGEVTPFGSSIPWDQELWLTMNVNGDGEMTPRFKLTSVPYAFRAGALVDGSGNAKTADDFAQLAPGSLQTVNAAVAALRLNQTGSGALLQLQGNGVNVFTVDKTGATNISGAVLSKNDVDSASAFDVQNVAGNSFLKVDTTAGQATFGSSTGAHSTLLQGGTGGVQITSGADINIGVTDTNATLLVIDTKSTAGDPVTATNGSMYYNSDAQKFRCYENSTWVDCIGGAPYIGTSATLVGGIQNVTANQTALALENMVFTTNTTVSTVGASGGFTAPADGSFRSCLVQNTANITAGTLTLRWRVNGVSVGSSACAMDSTAPNNREASEVLNPGVVTFVAGDIIDIAFDTSAAFAPTGTNDFTVYWGVEYSAGGGGGGAGGDTFQDIYDQSLTASVLTANNKDITFNLADTATDSDFVINIASGSTSRLVVQDNGTDTFSVNATGNITASGGLTVGNSASTTAGTIRWTGTDFEGYDGASWVSLTAGGGGSGAGLNIINRVKQVNESVISNITPQDDNELTFPVGANEEWTYRFVVQANSAAAADLRFVVTAPSGAICNTATSDYENAASDAQVGCGVSSALLNGGAAPELYEITGRVQNGATPGNVTLQWAQFTLTASNTIVYAGSYVHAVRSIGAGGNGQPFAQNGNAFGTTAEIGTTDTNGISIITDGVERIGISATGTTTLSGSLVANRTTTGITGTTSGTGLDTTALTLVADSFDVNDVILIDNVGQDYYTRITVDGGGGAYTVSPAVTFENTRTVTGYNVQNIGATESDYSSQANRFFQGYFLGGVVIGAGSTTISDGEINSTTTLSFQSGGGDVSIGGGLSIAGVITGDASGLTNISGADVDGSTLTAINASNISAGTLADGRLTANVALLSGSQTFTGLKDFSSGLTVSAGNLDVTGDIDVSGTITGATIVGAGSGITALNASNIASGSLADGRLSANVALLNGGQTFSALTTFSAGLSVTGAVNATGAISGATVSGDGSALSSLNASNISSGTLADGRLSANIALLNGGQTFSSLTGFGAGLSVTGAVNASGAIAGATISGDGSALTSLNASNISSGTLADGRLSANVALLTGSQTFSGSKTFSSGLVLGQSTITSLATVARAVSLPDDAGTICLSNSNTCGFLRLASGAIQTDASNNDVLTVNKTSATGNLITLQRSGGAVFTVANSGALQIQATGTSALDIRNVGGTSYFSVDTSTGTVRVGSSIADAVGVLFVLDTKNTTGDPTGINGGSYYNSADARTRCYENGFWSDCTTNRVLGETTLGVAGNTITVTLSGSTEYLKCRIDAKSRSAASVVNLRFNGDSGAASYSWNNYSIITTAVQDAQDSSDSEVQLTGTDTGTTPFSADISITNFADTRKAIDWTLTEAEPIATNTSRYSGGGVWADAVNQITSVSFTTSAGNFAAGSHAWCEGRNIR